MPTEIPVIFKPSYGNLTCYVADVSLKRVITKLTGHKSLTESDREALKELGFTFRVIQPHYHV